MERTLIDCRAVYTARATNPETGDMVLVGWDVASNKITYSVNGGPFQAVARQSQPMYTNPTRVAMELLYEHVAQCQANDNEEMTLP